MQRNWKQPFLSVTYSELIGRGVWHLFIHIPRLYIHELPKKYAPEQNFRLTKDSREKILDPRNNHEKKFCNHEIPTRKNFGPTKYPRE